MRDNFYSTHKARLEEKFGADVVEDLDIWVRGIVSSEAVTKDQFGQTIDGVENRLNVLDERIQNLSNDMVSFRTEVNQRFLSVDQCFDSLHQRFDSLRSEMDQRFDTLRSEMEQRFDSFRSDVDHRFDNLNERFDKLTEHMVSSIKWTVGTIALFGTIITVLITMFKFVKP